MNLKIEYLPLTEIKPYAGNAKLHPAEQVEQIIESIQDFGFNDPIAIWNGEIIEGHGRVVSLDSVNNAISNSSARFRRSLQLAGSRGTRTYGVNAGQAQMAIKMGYNTIDAGWAVIPLTKDAVVVSSKRAW